MCHTTEFFLDICTHFLNATHNIIGDKLTLFNYYTQNGHFSSAAITIISLVKSPSVSLLYEELFYNLDEQKIPSLIVSRSALPLITLMMRHVPLLDICHIHLPVTKIITLQIVPVNAPILCHILNSLSMYVYFRF